MWPFQDVASEPEKVFGRQTEVAWLRREGRDALTKDFLNRETIP